MNCEIIRQVEKVLQEGGLSGKNQELIGELLERFKALSK